MTSIAVLGAGNGGHCMSADLALAGHDVVLAELPEFAARLETVRATGEIRLTGIGRNGTARVRVSFDIAEAVAGADLLNLVLPAFGQPRFFGEILEHLRDGQVVVVWAGDFGSLELRELVRAQRPDLSIAIVETNTLPYGTRLAGPGHVELPLLAPRVLAAQLPDGAAPALPLLRELWPCVAEGPDVLGVALSNPNPVIHPPGALLNVGRIQYADSFNMYREGITEAVARTIRGLYGEVEAVAGALGTSVPEYADHDFRTRVSIMGVAFQAPFDTVTTIGDIAGPHSIEDRYLTEDLPYGLVPLAELGDRLGVDTPLADAIVTLGSSVCGRDFRVGGRGLDRLGLGDLQGDELLDAVRVAVAA